MTTVLALTAAVGAVAMIATALTAHSGQSVPVGPGIFVLFPLVFIGQFWAIAIMQARTPSQTRLNWWRRGRPDQPRRLASIRNTVFGELSGWLILTVAVVFYGMCGLAATSMSELTDGVPVIHTSGCRYTLENHGEVTCVSRDEYRRAAAAEQASIASVFGAFFAIQAAVIGSEVVARRDVSK